uniref:Uncharacterized protein n=1 Tax=Micrurus spixii TaxID=129469 RepID=A0A2D4M5I8_9SAUR
MVIWDNIDRIVEEQYKIIREMTSIPTTKTGKKPVTTVAISSPAASTQCMIKGMLAAEKLSTTTSAQSVQASLLAIQETMVMLQESMSKTHIESRSDRETMKTKLKTEIGEMKVEFRNLDKKIGLIQESIKRNEEKIRTIKQQSEQTEKKLELMDEKITGYNKETEVALIHLEMERVSYYLRFQNIKEVKEEDLTLVMAELLVELLQRDKNEIVNKIDNIYCCGLPESRATTHGS